MTPSPSPDTVRDLEVLLELRLRCLGQIEIVADLLRPPPRLVALALELAPFRSPWPLRSQGVRGGGEEHGGDAQPGGQRPSLLQHDLVSLTRL